MKRWIRRLRGFQLVMQSSPAVAQFHNTTVVHIATVCHCQDNNRYHFELAPHEHPGLHSGNGHYEQWYQNDSSNGHSAGYKFSTHVDTKLHSQDTDSWGGDDHFSKDDNEDADNEDADASATDTNDSKEEANLTRSPGDY